MNEEQKNGEMTEQEEARKLLGQMTEEEEQQWLETQQALAALIETQASSPMADIVQVSISAHHGLVPGIGIDLYFGRPQLLHFIRQLKDAYDAADPDKAPEIVTPTKRLHVPGEPPRRV